MKEFAFRDLKVGHKAIDFADDAIALSENLKSKRKHFRLIEQFKSASAYVSMNMAERKGRRSKNEFIQYLYIARDSLYETVILAILFEKRNWISKEELERLESEAFEIVSMIIGLINSIHDPFKSIKFRPGPSANLCQLNSLNF